MAQTETSLKAMRLPVVAGVLLAFSVTAAAADDPVRALLTLYEGEYERLSDPSDPSATERSVFMTLVDMPNIPGETLYLEWRRGGPDGPLDGQRIWAYATVGNRVDMRFYMLFDKAQAALTGVTARSDIDAEAVAAVTLDDLYVYEDDCVFHFTREGNTLSGDVGTGTCEIHSREFDTTMHPQTFIRMSPMTFIEDSVYRYDPAAPDSDRTGLRDPPRLPRVVFQEYLKVSP